MKSKLLLLASFVLTIASVNAQKTQHGTPKGLSYDLQDAHDVNAINLTNAQVATWITTGELPANIALYPSLRSLSHDQLVSINKKIVQDWLPQFIQWLNAVNVASKGGIASDATTGAIVPIVTVVDVDSVLLSDVIQDIEAQPGVKTYASLIASSVGVGLTPKRGQTTRGPYAIAGPKIIEHVMVAATPAGVYGGGPSRMCLNPELAAASNPQGNEDDGEPLSTPDPATASGRKLNIRKADGSTSSTAIPSGYGDINLNLDISTGPITVSPTMINKNYGGGTPGGQQSATGTISVPAPAQAQPTGPVVLPQTGHWSTPAQSAQGSTVTLASVPAQTYTTASTAATGTSAPTIIYAGTQYHESGWDKFAKFGQGVGGLGQLAGGTGLLLTGVAGVTGKLQPITNVTTNVKNIVRTGTGTTTANNGAVDNPSGPGNGTQTTTGSAADNPSGTGVCGNGYHWDVATQTCVP